MTMRVGIIGLGFGAEVHLPAFTLLPDTIVTAICGRTVARTQAFAEAYAVPGVYTDYRELIASDDVDAVSIAVPTDLHHAVTLAALAAGKAVLCEKPLARTITEARELARTAEARGVTAMVDHEWRFLPARARMQELIAEGYLGTVSLVQVTFLHALPADGRRAAIDADTGGVLVNLGAHHIDALRWWFGEIAEVVGTVADDAFAVSLRFASGAMGSVTLSVSAAHGPGEEVRAFGDGGMLALAPDGTLWGATRAANDIPAPIAIPARLLGSGIAEVDARPLPLPAHPLLPPFLRLARLWVDAVPTGISPSPNFADGLHTQEVLDAIARSHSQRKWITLAGPRPPVSSP